MGRWLQTYQTPEEILMGKMKNVCLSVMAKLKSENPEFNLDFESFVKELSSDEPRLNRMFEIMIKDSYRRGKTPSRHGSQTPISPSLEGAARMVMDRHRLPTTFSYSSYPRVPAIPSDISDGTRLPPFYPTRPRSQNDSETQTEMISPDETSYEAVDVNVVNTAREEEKEDESVGVVVETRETVGLGTVVA